ncbi:DUF4105 domain-containing protein [Silvanigrella aquatica]|uniref:Lnb N-terminal periplasmic domain-containing protein n=1 Tax=Silvanigrella aquatica TaxID=1915309 RepID=UPI001E4D4346|nr:DUF4105 domain-containing protein [Silvanigrella aquatica]
MFLDSKKVSGKNLTYTDELIADATSKKLWETRAWKKILFIPDRFLSLNQKSLISEKSFFLSVDGKNNPEHELIASLNSFQESIPINPPKDYMHPQCKHPARFYWLVNELKIDDKKFVFQKCPELHKFIDYLDYEGVSLVFSNYIADGPGSLFGHTFLRLHRNTNNSSESAILDDIANFSAFVPAIKGLLYPIKGLAGGYQGRFSVMPYYQKIQEYNNYESRDLWEYKLNLTKNEIRMLELVLWEMGSTYIDYYYLDDNCSYVMLALLEAAKPDLYLTGKTLIYAIPSDTIRIVTKTPNFVTNITYRPSVLSRYLNRMAVLSKNENNFVEQVLSNYDSLSSLDFKNCDKFCKARVIDASLEYIDYKEKLVGSNEPIIYQNLRNKLLIARANDAVKSEPLKNDPQSSPPHLGHDSGLLSLNLGSSFSGDVFSDIRFRPALHDIEANENGYSNGLGVGFLDTILRADYKNSLIYLKNFHLLEITSLPEQVPNIDFLAWHFDTGYEYGFGYGDAASQGREYLKLGIGSALFGFQNQFLLFSIVEADVGYSKDFGAHIGPTVLLGAMAKLSHSCKIVAKSELSKRFNKDRNIDAMENSLNLSYFMVQNFETQLSLTNKEGVSEVSLGLRIYF